MKHFLAYLLLLTALLVSCTREGADEAGRPYIRLSVWSDESFIETRAGSSGTEPGVRRYHENDINEVDFFFFPGVNPTGASTLHRHVVSGTREGYDVFLIEMFSNDINTLIFPVIGDVRRATVFAVANYSGTNGDFTSESYLPTLDELEQLSVTTDFVQESAPGSWQQDSFMMSGRVVIDLIDRSQILAATGEIPLARYACKMTTAVHVANQVELDDGQVWKPMLAGMEIYLDKANGSVNLSGLDETPAFISYGNNPRFFVTEDINDNTILYPVTDMTTFEGKDYYNTFPMYMYPQKWVYGDDEGDDQEPFLKLVLPWARTSDNGYSTTQRTYYYKIPMPVDFDCQFIRNNWYHLFIDVGMLGTETDEVAIPVTPGSCYMVYWQDKDVVVKQAEIGNARYLSVEHETYDMHNTTTLDVPYTTSHPVIIKSGSIKVTRPYYGEETVGNNSSLGGKICQASSSSDPYPVGTLYLDYSEDQRLALSSTREEWLQDTGGAITLFHQLNNDYKDSKFDYSPYRIAFSLVHEDRPTDTRYQKDIVIYQYPAIYIEATLNSDDTFVNTGVALAGKNQYVHTSDHWGYVYVDGLQRRRFDMSKGQYDLNYYTNYYADPAHGGLYYGAPNRNEMHWRLIWYTGGSRDLFKMNVTVLPSHSDFVLGDPREDDINNLGHDSDEYFWSSPSLYGDSPRRLKYYYPTEDSERTRNMLAPSYRIASKCGGIEFDGISYADAQKRCAAYQEDGFPAGRWRLPSRGEIGFIAQLSANSAFTFLFSEGVVYWSAHGAIKVSGTSLVDQTSKVALARCVYDSWYWGDTQQDQRDLFVWGDQPR